MIPQEQHFVSNSNLLDNWYFVDPINQRGKTEYTEYGYTIDRWSINQYGLDHKLSLVDGGIHVTGEIDESPGWSMSVIQMFEKDFQRGVYTVSFLEADGQLYSATFNYQGVKLYAITEDSGARYTINFGILDQYGVFSFYPNPSIIGGVTISAVKLERGDRQTLAHREGNTWVLNETPAYGEQLAKCQRYQLVLPGKANTTGYACAGSGVAQTEYMVVLFIPTPVPLYKQPAVSMMGAWYFDNGNGWGGSSDIACTNVLVNQVSANLLSIYCYAESGLVPHQRYELVCTVKVPSSIIIDANL